MTQEYPEKNSVKFFTEQYGLHKIIWKTIG